jgi:AcrR family transcriptional regulator
MSISNPLSGSSPINDAHLGLRERKKRATRSAISAAALRLSVESGLDAVTVDRIAAEVNISPRTFFNYFANKEQAVVAGDAAVAEKVAIEFRARPPDEHPFESIRQATIRAVRSGPLERERWMRYRELRRDPKLIPLQHIAVAKHESALRTAIEERLAGHPSASAPATFSPALLAACAMIALRIGIQGWLDSEKPPDGACSERDQLEASVGSVFAELSRGPGSFD